MRLPPHATRALYRAYAAASPWYRAGHLGHYLRQVDEAERWSARDLAEYQTRLLGRLLAAAERTRFYPARLAAAGIRPGDAPDLASFSRIAVLEKAEVNADPEALRVPDAPRSRPGATSGTTGAPMRVSTTAEMDAAARAARWRMLGWYGIPFGAPTLGFKGGNQKRDRVLAATWATASALLGQTLRDAYRHQPRDNLALLKRLRPAAVFGYPNVLVELARDAEHLGVDLGAAGVRLAVVGGESVHADQRERIAAAFGARVASLYGSHEGHYMAMECPDGGLHVQETVVLEIVDAAGRPLPPGEEGDVVITPLLGHSLPLLRFRLGDRGRLVPGGCRCGRPTPSLALDVCRIAEMIELPDRRRVSSQVFQPMIHNAFGLRFGVDPRAYRVVQTAPHDYEFQLVLPDGRPLPAGAGAFLSDLVARALGPGIRVSLVAVPDLPQDTSGKRRCFIPGSEAARYRIAPAGA